MSYSPALDRLMVSIQPHLPGCLPDPIKDVLFLVTDEFFKTTKVWSEMQPITTVAAVQNYDVVPDSPSIIDCLLGVWDVSRGMPDGVVPGSDNWQATTATYGLPVSAGMPTPGCVLLRKPPNGALTLNAVVSLTVNAPKTADGFPIIPEWINERYAVSAWMDGVLGRMFSQPAKPYTNQNMAVYHMRRYRNAMAVARGQATRQNKYGGQAWKFPQSFRNYRPRG